MILVVHIYTIFAITYQLLCVLNNMAQIMAIHHDRCFTIKSLIVLSLVNYPSFCLGSQYFHAI